MTNLRKYVVLGASMLAIVATTFTAFAATNYSTPAEAVAGLTGKTVEDIIAVKNETGKTYGTIAYEAGKSEEFKDELLSIKKQILDERVAAGTITQEKANEIITAIEENQVNCDGIGSERNGKMMGAGFGGMMGQGSGRGQGRGNGQGLGNSSCQFQ